MEVLMNIKKKKLKTIGLDEYQVGNAYFRDMAECGLLLEDAGLLCYSFRKDVPQKVRYSIQNFPEGCSKEKAQYIMECGWDYVCDDSEYYVFRGGSDAREIEIPIREQLRDWNIRKEEKDKRISGLLMTGAPILVLNAYNLLSGGYGDSGVILIVTLGVLWVYQIIGEALGRKQIKAQVEYLTEQRGSPGNENWRHRKFTVWMGYFFMVALWIVIVWGCWSI